jgi:hypothetical protein
MQSSKPFAVRLPNTDEVGAAVAGLVKVQLISLADPTSNY